MCRKKNRPRNTHNNGNGKESKRPKDRDQKKPAGYKKGYPQKIEPEKGSRRPKSFQEKMAESTAAFTRKHYHPVNHSTDEIFPENPPGFP